MTTDDNDDETQYWMPSGRGNSGGRRIHPDRNCRLLNRARNIRRAHPVDVDKREVCNNCSGDGPERRTWQDQTYQRALKNADPNDFGCDVTPFRSSSPAPGAAAGAPPDDRRAVPDGGGNGNGNGGPPFTIDALDEALPETVVHTDGGENFHRPSKHEDLTGPKCNCNPASEWLLRTAPPTLFVHQNPDRLCTHTACFGDLFDGE